MFFASRFLFSVSSVLTANISPVLGATDIRTPATNRFHMPIQVDDDPMDVDDGWEIQLYAKKMLQLPAAGETAESTNDGGSGGSSPMETEEEDWSDAGSRSEELPKGEVEQGRTELLPRKLPSLKLPILSVSERPTKDDVWFVAEFLDQLSEQAETILEGDGSPFGLAAEQRRSATEVQAVFQAEVAAFWAHKAVAQAETAKEQSRGSREAKAKGDKAEKAAAAALAAAKAEVAVGKALVAWEEVMGMIGSRQAKIDARKAKEAAAAAAVEARRAADAVAVVPVVVVQSVVAQPDEVAAAAQKWPEWRPRRAGNRSASPVPYRRGEPFSRTNAALPERSAGETPLQRGRTSERSGARQRSVGAAPSLIGVVRSTFAAWCCPRKVEEASVVPAVHTTEECECPAAPAGAALSERTQQHDVAALEKALLEDEDASIPFPQMRAVTYRPTPSEELERVRSLWQTRGFFSKPAPVPSLPELDRFWGRGLLGGSSGVLARFEESWSGQNVNKYVRILDAEYGSFFDVAHEATVRALIYIERLLKLSADVNKRMYLNHGGYVAGDKKNVWFLQFHANRARDPSIEFSKPLLRAMVSKLAIRRTFLAAMVLALKSLLGDQLYSPKWHHPLSGRTALRLTPEQLEMLSRDVEMMLPQTEITTEELAERVRRLRREGGTVPFHAHREDLTGFTSLLRHQPVPPKCDCGRSDCPNPQC